MWPFRRDNSGREPQERQALKRLGRYVNRLLAEYANELDGSEDKRLAFFAFVVGGVSGLALREGLTAPQAHALAVALFRKGFRLSLEDSVGMAQFGIGATAHGSPWAAAAHAGMDEFLAWQADPDGFAPTRLRAILNRAPRRG